VSDYRILITGSRTWADRALLSFELGVAIGESGRELRHVVLVHGACPSGADAIAAALATSWGYRQEAHPADWRPGGVFDRSAGFRRNAEMIATRPDVVLAFIRDGSAGATHCAGLAEKAGIPVRRFTA
jgi:YspA, cpYpsA-related SLOG family